MRPPAAFLLLTVAAALATFAIPPVRAADPAPSPAAAASPTPDTVAERIEALAKALVAAPDDDARRRLLAEAPPDLAGDERVRRRFYYLTGALIYAGEYDRAAALHRFSRQWCGPLGDRVGLMLSEWAEGNIEGFRGNNRGALAKFEVVGRFFAETGDTKREASVLTGASIVHLRLGDYRRALAGVERALAIHRAAGDRELITNDLNLTGNIYLEQGQAERSFAFWEEALKTGGDDEEEWRMYLFHSIGEGHASLGDLPRALDYLERSLAIARKREERPRVANVLTTLGRLRAAAGQPEAAEAMFREALALGEALKETDRQATALIGLADAVAPRAPAEAMALAEQASTLARATGEPGKIWPARTLAGRLLRRAGRTAEAREALTEAIAAIEDARGRLTGGDVEATAFFEDKVAPYHEMVALLVGENRTDEALAFAERAKARVLLEVLSGPKNGFAEALTPAERENLAKRAEEIAALNKERAAAPAERRAEVEQRLARARQARDAAEGDAVAAHPELRQRFSAYEQGPPLVPRTFGALLGDDDRGALVEFVVGTEESFAFVLRRPAGAEQKETAARAVRLPLGRATLAERTERYRRTLAERGLGWAREARALGEDLLGPLRPMLAGVDRLVIVPDGPLWELPFQTLPLLKGEGALRAADTFAARRLSVAPALGFLVQARGGSHPATAAPVGSGRLLAFGNPAVRGKGPVAPRLLTSAAIPGGGTLRDGELVPLPEAENEVRALAKLYGPEHSRVFVGAEAREAVFGREAGGDYDVIHFATHGVCNDRAPLYSHLLMSQADLGADEDGLLEAWELMRQPLRARLAVLSACETGRGRVGAGEGMLGLSWALFTAGCPSCVVSQWKVDSASNTDLMVGFHRELRAGAGRAEALRRASLALAERPEYRHPFYWGPFVLVGED